MKFTHFLFPALLIAGMNVVASAADDLQPVTFTVNTDNGGLTGSGNYRSTWSSNKAEDGLQVIAYRPDGTTTANNFNNATGWLKLNSGNPAPTTVKIIPNNADKWYVSAYEFTAAHSTSATNLAIAVQGKAAVSIPSGTPVVFSETLEQGTGASFVFSGTNGNPVELQNFVVTLTPIENYVEPEYKLPVTATVMTDGKFADDATWYNLQITTGLFDIFDNGEAQIPLNGLNSGEPNMQFDSHQWCFVEQDNNQVRIYNRAAGTERMLAAPRNGSGYPRMMAPGNAEYCYEWVVKPAEFTSGGVAINAGFNGKNPVYISLADNSNAILNNFAGNGLLNFWTGGYDNNSVVVPVVAETVVSINLETGYLTRDGEVDSSNRWQSLWNNNGDFNITFGTLKNNMTTTTGDVLTGDLQLASGGTTCGYNVNLPNDYYVSDLHLKAAMSSAAGTATFVVGPQTFELQGTEPVAVDFENVEPDVTLGMSVTAVNNLNNNVVLTDFTVRVKRHFREYVEGTIVFRRSDGSHQRRIPAITTVGGNGPHAGRLVTAYDYRWCNGDLAAGNIDLQIAVSDDNGATWTTPDFARDAEGNPVTEYNHKWTKGSDWSSVQAKAVEAWDAAWGDAALVSDRETGKIMMIAVGGPIGFFASRRNNTQSAIRWTSDDGGETWSAAENITEKIYSLFDGEPRNGQIDGMFFGSGRVMQSRYVKVGPYYRVYTVISTQNNGGSTRNFVLYSDDMGETWGVLGGNDQCPVESTADEPKAEELPDGSVLLAARNQTGNRNFNVFRYLNPTTGEGKWLGRVNTNMGMGGINACNGEIFMVPARSVEGGEPCFLALQSFPYGGSRQMVSIAWKALTEGADFVDANCFTSWDGRYQVTYGGHESTYSTMSLQNNGNIAFFYEEQLTGSLDGVFKSLPLETITNGRYEYFPDSYNAVARNLTLSLAEYRNNEFAGENEDDFYNAVNAYMDDPTYANYININRAEYGYDGTPDTYDFNYESTLLWPGAEVAVVEELVVTPATLTLNEGETATLTVNKEGEVEWTSSDELVVTVENGVVTAVKAGEATVTATVNGQSATCSVTVEPAEIEDSIVEVDGTDAATVVYDLQGRRVSATLPGLYIVNGKKTVVNK